MKKMFTRFALLISLFAINSLSTSAQVTDWIVSQPGMASSACTDQFNNSFTCGQFVGTSIIGGNTYISVGNQDVIVEKYDPFGNFLWATPFGGIGGDFSQKIIYDGLGNVWVTGQFSGTMIAGTFTLVSTGSSDAFLVKLDAASGAILFAQKGGSTGSDAGMAVKSDSFGNIFLSGIYSGAFNFGGATLTSQGMDVFLLKLDNAGTPIWAKKITGTGIETMWCMTVDANDNIYIGGFTTSTTAVFAGTSVNFTATTQFVAKFNNLGNYVWSTKAYFNGEVYGVSVDAAGSVYFTGNFDTQAIFGTDTLTGVGSDDILDVKINNNGTFAWAHSYGGTGIDEGYDMKCNAQGEQFITGSFQGAFTFGTTNLNAGSFSKTYIAKIDSAGAVNWVIQSSGSVSSHISNGIAINNNDDVYITGSGSGVFAMGCYADSLHESYLVKVADHANIIQGTVFNDMNNDGIYDIGENGIPNVILELDNSPYVSASNNTGVYQMYTNTGVHTVNIPNLPLYHTLTTSPVLTSNFVGMGNIDTAKHFGLYPIPNVNDLRIDITPVSSPKAGHVLTYLITYTNVGTTTLNGTVSLKADPAISFLNSAPSPSNQIGQTFTWNVGSLVPMAVGTIHANFNIPGGLSIGSLITDSVSITPILNDSTPYDNIQNGSVAVVGPFDPNFKTVNIDTLYSVNNPGWLEYTIHFQNVGNDTAFTVIIIDTLSQHLNLSSMEIVSSAHTISNFNIHNGNVAEFRFNNIMLPDSTTDPIASQGFVKYRIKYLNTLLANETIINFADIYFDYNAAIRTNSAVTIYIDSTLSVEQYDAQKTSLYPNPANDYLVVESKSISKNTVMTIYTIQGLKMREQFIENAKTVVDMRNLASGVYFIRIKNEQGITVKKFVKE